MRCHASQSKIHNDHQTSGGSHPASIKHCTRIDGVHSDFNSSGDFAEPSEQHEHCDVWWCALARVDDTSLRCFHGRLECPQRMHCHSVIESTTATNFREGSKLIILGNKKHDKSSTGSHSIPKPSTKDKQRDRGIVRTVSLFVSFSSLAVYPP